MAELMTRVERSKDVNKARLCRAVRMLIGRTGLHPRLVYDAAVAMANFNSDLSAFSQHPRH
jgi:hypothetical protein